MKPSQPTTMTERSPRRPSPAEGRQHAVEQLTGELEAGLTDLFSSEQYQAWLDIASRFHRYSWGNISLIMRQYPEATRVAGYRRWQQLGRQVKRGEQGIKILAPHRQRIVEEVEGEEEPVVSSVLRGFGVATVFDISQTEGEALPEPPSIARLPRSSERAGELSLRLERFLARPGIEVVREPTLPDRLGYYSPGQRRIGVDDSLSSDQAAKTLAHETAHFVADHLPGVDLRDAETVAEGAAYVVLRHAGLDPAGYSFGYIARWAGDLEVLKRNLAGISLVSRTIIEGIEEPLSSDDDMT